MAAGNMAHRRNHNADREAVRERDAEKAQAAGAAQVLIRADGAGAKENQGKSADEFRDQFLRDAVHEGSSQDGKDDAADSNGCILAALRRGKPVLEEADSKESGKLKFENGNSKLQIGETRESKREDRKSLRLAAFCQSMRRRARGSAQELA